MAWWCWDDEGGPSGVHARVQKSIYRGAKEMESKGDKVVGRIEPATPINVEMLAMQELTQRLEELDRSARERVMRYLISRYMGNDGVWR